MADPTDGESPTVPSPGTGEPEKGDGRGGPELPPSPQLPTGRGRALDRTAGNLSTDGNVGRRESGEGSPGGDPSGKRAPCGGLPGGGIPRGRVGIGIVVYLGLVLALLALMAPGLLAAREGIPPGITWVSGFPIAWDGLYFFTGVALAVGFLSTLRRGAGWVGSPILALAGLGAYEASYAFAFALTTGGLGRLVPAPGFSATGWAGFGTWFLVELLIASLVVVNWEGRGLDRITVAVALSFVLLLAIWDLVLGWGFPPYQNSAPVLLVNSAAEVTGALWLPLAFTAGPRNGRLPSGSAPWRRGRGPVL